MRLSVVFILHEKVLVEAVSGEGDGGGTQTGQGALEPVPSGEGADVSPGLTATLMLATMENFWEHNSEDAGRE